MTPLPPPTPRSTRPRPLVAAVLAVLVLWAVLAVMASAVTSTRADVLTDEVMDRLGVPTAAPAPTPTCAVVVITDEYGLEVPVRECG